LRHLKIIQKSLGNLVFNKEINKIAENILNGESIAGALRKSPYFPELLIDMVSIGEKAGSLDDMLLSVAVYYEDEVAEMVENMSSLIEPIITVALGGMILLLALALFLPMWEMMTILK
jgi:type II secretory pathway component PulF